MDGEELQQSFTEAVGTLKTELDSQTFVSTLQEMASVCQGILQETGDRSKRKFPKATIPLVVARDSATVMLYLAGFEEVGDNMSLPDGANLTHVQILLGVLQEALKRASTLSQMMSTGMKIEGRVRTYNSSESVESGDPLTVVAHLSYHYFMRWFLMSTHGNPAMAVSFNSQIRVSMDGIEMATRTLGIMKPDSAARILWTALKRDVLHQLQEAQNMTEMQHRADMMNEMLSCASEILEELKRNSPQICVTMFFYMHLTKMIMMVTSAGHMVSREDANRYIQTSFDLPMARFTKEYGDSIDKVRNFCVKMQEKELAPDELAQLYEIVVWQSNDFLEHFVSLAEPSVESGLPRCRNAPLSTMSSQLSSILTGNSSKSSSSDPGGPTYSSFPGVGIATGTQQSVQSSDQEQLQDLHMAMNMQIDDRRGVSSEDADYMQAMTDAAFDHALARPTDVDSMMVDNKGGHRLGEDSTSGHTSSATMEPTKNRPEYKPVVYNPEDDAALDKELYGSDEDLDITEKEDCETEKEKKFHVDEKGTKGLSSSMKHTNPVVTTSQPPVQMNQSEQEHISIQPLHQRPEADMPNQQLQLHRRQPQQQVQPEQQRQQKVETDQTSDEAQPRRTKELSKAAQAALAREKMNQQKQQQQQQQSQQGPSTSSSKQKTVLPSSQHHKSVMQLKSVQNSQRSADSTDRHQVKVSSETPPSESGYGSSSASSSNITNTSDKRSPTTTTQPSSHKTIQTRPTDAAARATSDTPLDPQPGARQSSQPQSQAPNSQPSARTEIRPLAVQSPSTQNPVHKAGIDGETETPLVTPMPTPEAKTSAQSAVGQPHVQMQQSFPPVNQRASAGRNSYGNGQSIGVASLDGATSSLTGKGQTSFNPATSSSALGDHARVTTSNRRPRQSSQSSPSAIPGQFRSMSIDRLPQLLEAMKTDADAEEGLKIIEKLIESKEESLTMKEKEQKVLQEHLSKFKAPVVANTLQRSLDQKCEEVQDLQEELRRLAAAKARANDIMRSAREVEMTELDPEFLYGILESFLKRIENDHDTMVKVLKAWLDYAPRQVVVEICDRLEIEREGDDPKVWVQKIREREQEVEEGQLAD